MSGWTPNPAGATNGNDSFFGSALADTAFGLDGNDSLTGLALADLLDGGLGNDTLSGGTDDDTLDGGAGDDSLLGNDGLDSIVGGDGRDQIRGGNDADTILGNADADGLNGDAGNDLILGGPGDDNLSGDAGEDWLDGEAGTDFLFGGLGNDRLEGGLGPDNLSGQENDDLLLGGFGLDTISGGTGQDTLEGGAGGDSLRGDAGNDVLLGGVGNDIVQGGVDNDTLRGEASADNLQGEAGNDLIDGGTGSDSLTDGSGTASGADTLLGGIGSDSLNSASGGDSLDGGGDRDLAIIAHRFPTGPSADAAFDFRPRDSATPTVLGDGSSVIRAELFRITGSSLNDTLQGLDDKDFFFGLGGADSLVGRGGADTLVDNTTASATEANTLDGGIGNDSLISLGGADSIIGGAGADTLAFGGTGANQAVAFDAVAGDTLLALGNGATVSGIEVFAFNGTTGNDSVAALAGDDTLGGGGGDDSLFGRGGDDSLVGGAGNDSLDAGDGNDRLAGDGGNDTLLGGIGNDSVQSAGADNDLVDLGEGNDSIQDDVSADGRDTLLGGAGDDTVFNPGGENSVVGGQGLDVFSSIRSVSSFAGSLDFRPVDSENAATLGASTLVGFERFSLTGTANADTLAGLGLDDWLEGGFINTGGSGDSLLGLAGNDTLQAYNTAGTLEGGVGNDLITIRDRTNLLGTGRIDGGAGTDTLVYAPDTSVTQPLDFRPLDSAVATSLRSGGPTVTGVEVFRITTGQLNDTIFGLGGDDSLTSAVGQDWLAGAGGNDTISTNAAIGAPSGTLDTLQGGSGNDLFLVQGNIGAEASIDGGAGIDQLNLDGFPYNVATGYDFRPMDAATPTGNGLGSSIVNVERFVIRGTRATDTIFGLGENDSINGDQGNDSLGGGGGDDTIRGDLDADSIDGGAGNDYIIGLSVGDVIEGGAGEDTLAFATNEALDIDLSGPTLVYRGTAFTITGFEHFEVLNSPALETNFGGGADTVRGGNLAETFRGQGRADSLFGGGGNDVLAGDFIDGGGLSTDPDTLVGDAGDDTLESRAGNDSLVGGEGDDLASIQRLVATVPIVFLPTDSVTPATLGDGSTVVGVERFQIIGSPGTDTLAGLDGDDVLISGSNIEQNVFRFDSGRGGDHSMMGRGGNDQLFDGEGNDTLLGGDGNDILFLTTGDDSFDGGAGSDSLEFGSEGGAELTLDGQMIGGTQAVEIRGIEWARGNVGDDRLTGLAAAAETLLGAGGDDTVVATGGADSLVGGESIDLIYRAQVGFAEEPPNSPDADIISAGASTGAVTIDLAAQTVSGGLLESDSIAGFEGAEGGTGDDSLLGNASDNRLIGQDGADTTAAGAGFDSVDGGAGDDSAAGDADEDTLQGGAGHDTLAGGAGADSVDAGADDDVVRWAVGEGADTLDGGASTDLLVIEGGSFATEAGPEDFTRYIITPASGGTASLLARNFESALCFAPGTRIAIPGGERPIQALRVGDWVRLATGGVAPVLWVGCLDADVAHHRDRARVAPVLIRAGALGPGLPARDLRVSPDHGMFLDGAIVAAHRLLNGRSIVQEPWWTSVAYLHIELPSHAVILAEGAATESYLDDGRRGQFDNAELLAQLTIENHRANVLIR